MDPETLYRQIGRLIETMPAFGYDDELTPEDHLWIGRADALIAEGMLPQDLIDWRAGVALLHYVSQHETGLMKMRTVLYRLLARAELKAPPRARGAFLPVGASFDAYAALAKVLEPARNDILVVDPYLDETVLTEFSGPIGPGVALRLPEGVAKPCEATVRSYG